LRSLFDSLRLGLDGSGPLRMLPFSLVQRRLRLCDGLLPAVALFLSGGVFPRLLAIAALLLPFVGASRLPLRRLVGRPEAVFFGVRPAGLRGALDGRAIASPRFVGSSACSLKGLFEPTGRLSMMPGFAMVAATTSGSSLCLAAPW
jgi:hypothetical protein